jgi:hypothetical protein
MLRCHHSCLCSRRDDAAADSTAVIGDGDEQDVGRTGVPRGAARASLRAVDGPLGPPEPPPATRLRREFKGLTVADLSCLELVEQLPGRVRSALRHLQRGDLAAAERAMPGEFAPVLPGPGHQRRQRSQRVLVVVLLVLLAATTVALYW